MALDQATTALLEQLAASGLGPLHELTPAEARGLDGRAARRAAPRSRHGVGARHPGPGVGRVRAGPGADPGPRPRGVIVYYHGGGWVIGGLADFDMLGRQLASGPGAR